MTGIQALENINYTKEMDEQFETNNLKDVIFEIKQTNGYWKTYVDIKKMEGTKVTCWEQHKNDSKLVTVDLNRYNTDRVEVM